jgi:hypothetical protein
MLGVNASCASAGDGALGFDFKAHWN